MLGTTFLGLEHEGELAQCRSCGHPVRSRTAVCPHCGMEKPAGRRPSARAAVLVLAAVVLGALAIGLRQQVFHSAPRATTGMTSAPSALQPIVAHPIQATPPPLPNSAPNDTAVADSPVVGAADSAVVRAADSMAVADSASGEATPLLTRWVADWSNMRTAPANDAPVVRVLAPGTMVRATPGKWGWWVIQYRGDTVGYIAGALLRASRPTRRP